MSETNLTPLEQNTQLITEIDALVDALPDAGSGGGGDANPTAVSKAVNFIDFDGTIRYSYTLDEVAALTDLPALPAHDGLVCQGWNWTLTDIKALGREVTVGAVYITDDGKTRLYITIDQTDRMTVPIWLTQAVANGVTVDWGDGSAVETSETAESEIKFNHTYAMTGDYVIRLGIVGNGTVVLGQHYANDMMDGTSSGGLFGDQNNSVCAGMLTKIELGAGLISLNAHALSGCANLKTVTQPTGLVRVGDSELAGNRVKSYTVPPSVTEIGPNAFYASDISSVSIPKSVTVIGEGAFYETNCHTIFIPDGVETIMGGICGTNLTRLVFPSSVTSIGSPSSGGGVLE